MNEKDSAQTILIRRKDVEDLLEQFNEHAHSSWSDWLGTRIRELPTLTVKGELTLQGDSADTYRKKDDLNKIMAETLRSINRSLDQLTANLRAQLEASNADKEPKTNGDWIRSMTDEEIATVLADAWPCEFNDYNLDARMCNAYDGDCRACCLDFLKAKRVTTGNEANPNAKV
jgi:hypothetical protein